MGVFSSLWNLTLWCQVSAVWLNLSWMTGEEAERLWTLKGNTGEHVRFFWIPWGRQASLFFRGNTLCGVYEKLQWHTNFSCRCLCGLIKCGVERPQWLRLLFMKHDLTKSEAIYLLSKHWFHLLFIFPGLLKRFGFQCGIWKMSAKLNVKVTEKKNDDRKSVSLGTKSDSFRRREAQRRLKIMWCCRAKKKLHQWFKNESLKHDCLLSVFYMVTLSTLW